LCGTEWHTFQDVHAVEWDFSNLDKELISGQFSNLDEKRLLYLFGGTEPQMVDYKGESRVIPIPFIVVVDSTYPVPEQLGINAVQMTEESIVPMSRFKMGWHPLEVPRDENAPVPERPKKRSRAAKKKPQVFALKCSQRGSALRQLSEERLHKFDYCMPYIMFPKKALAEPIDTAVEIILVVPGRTAPSVFEFDWSMDDVDDMVEEKMTEEELPADFKATLEKTIRDTVNTVKAERRAARAQKKAEIEALPAALTEALDNLKVHKFYPCQKDPDVSAFKSRFINRYYGQATEVH